MKQLYLFCSLILLSSVLYAQPTNDDCATAQDINASLNCALGGPSVAGTTLLGMPDPFMPSLSCIMNSDTGVWYTFNAVGPDLMIEDNMAGIINVAVLQNPGCANPTYIEVACGPLPLTLDNVLTPGENYLLLVAFDGGSSGNFDLCVTNWPALTNDEACTATNVTGTGGTYSGSTYGAFGLSEAPCDVSNEYVNSQFFVYNAPPNIYQINVEVTSPDLANDILVDVFFGDPDCNTNFVIEEYCMSNVPFESLAICIDPTTPIYFTVSTKEDNNGDFTFSVANVIPTNCNDNEICDVSQNLGVLASTCMIQTFMECNLDACPENFTVGACDFTDGATVWYEFTTDAMSNAVDVVLNNSDFPDLQFIFIEECDFSGANFCDRMTAGVAELLQIPVLPNSTYYIGVVDPGSDGGDFDLNLTIYPILAHDDPCYNFILPGVHNLNNHCTTAEIFSFNLNTNCPTPLTEATAWYEVIVPPGTDAINMTLSNNPADPLPGNVMIQMGIRLPSQGCAGENFVPVAEECTSLNAPFIFEDYCFPNLDTVIYYVLVGTQSDETGSYDLNIELISSPCTSNDSCSQIAVQQTMEPITPPDDATPPVPVCLTGCTTYACPENFTTANCDFTLYNAVWYQINTDPNATLMNLSINVEPGQTWNPVMGLFTGDCNNLAPVLVNMGASDCIVSGGQTINAPQIPIESSTTYYLLIGSESGLGGDFEVCVTTEITLEACIDAHTLELIDRENNLPLTDPFCPGELITFSYHVEYGVDPQGQGNNCQWLQGVVPIFGEGWDIDNFVPTPIGGVWDWYIEGSVDYNDPNFRYSIYMEGGRIKIAHYTGYTANYDVANAFDTGTLLPAGWFATSPGNAAGCVAGSTDPDETYGAPAGCGSTYILDFDFSIRVKENCTPGDNLEIAIYEFADGSVGCWIEQRCALDLPIVYDDASVECLNANIRDSTYYICSGDLTDIFLDAGNPAAVISYFVEDNPDVTGEMGGTGNSIVQQLDNTSSCMTQQVNYKALALASPTARCNPDTADITVIVYSPIEITQDPPIPFFCADEEVMINLLDYVCGGSGNYSLSWTNNRMESGMNPLIQAIYAPGTITFDLDVTDDFGCTSAGQVSVEVNDELTVNISGLDEICEYEAPTTLTASAVGGSGTIAEYDWTRPDGTHLVGLDSTIDADQTGLYLITVTDDAGCVAMNDFDIMVIERPQYNLSVFPADASTCAGAAPVFIDVMFFHNFPYTGTFDLLWQTPVTFTQNINGITSFNTNVPGTYIFTVTNSFGCVNSDSILVTVIDPPASFTDSLFSCDDGSGEGLYDLTNAEAQVTGGAAVDIAWYVDSLQTTPIADPANYTSGISIVYAVVTDPNTGCESLSTRVYLLFLSTFTANDASQTQCLELGGFGSFDLDGLEGDISGGSGTVEFYADTALNDQITNTSDFESGDTLIYAIIRDADNCISNLALILLTTDTLLEAFPAALMACRQLDGTATYDLTSVNATVNNGLSLSVIWYEDASGTMTIADPTQFNTTATSVFATVSDGTCAANIAEVSLTSFTSGPTPSDTLKACDEGGVGTFDLTSNGDPIVLGGNTGTVNWYENDDASTPVVDPSNYTTGNNFVYAVFEDAMGCISDITALPLEIGPIFAIAPDLLSLCENPSGQAVFDLTVRDMQVSDDVVGRDVLWFEDMALTIPINPANAFTTSGTIVYAIVRQGACESAPVPLELELTVDLPANDGSMDECIRANGLGIFNLNQINNQVNTNTNFTFRYYVDTTDLSDSITNSGMYISGDAIIFVVVYDGDCRSFAQEITLTTSIQVQPVDNLEFIECDEGMDMSTFDLTQFDDQVSGNATSMVVWHELQDLSQPIATPTTYVSSDKIVYALVTDQRGCVSNPMAVQLTVETALFAEDATLSRCDEGGGIGVFDLSVYESAVKGGIGSRIVTWYSDTLTAPINPITNYMGMNGDVVFAVVSDGRCVSKPRAYTLEVVNDLPAFAGAAVACDEGGSGTFNLNDALAAILNGNNFTVEFYQDQALTMLITGDISAYLSSATTIFAITIDGNCRSLPVEVDLSLIPEIVATAAVADECDDGSGNATFDLTTLEARIDNGQGFSVLWFLDAAMTMPIVSPDAYISSGVPVFAVLTNGNCSSLPVQIDLSVTTITGTAIEGFACNEGAGDGTFNLAALENSIITAGGQSVTWFEDVALMNMITSTASYISSGGTIYAVVSDGRCDSQPIAITLTLTDKLPAAVAQIADCDDGDGQLTFDLTTLEVIINSGGFADVVWYLDAAGTMVITNEDAFSSSTATVYAQVVDGACRSDIIPIGITVQPLPIVDAGEPQMLDCRTDFIDIIGSGPAGTYTYAWTTLDGNIVSGSNALNVQVDAPGTYRLEIVNTATNCSQFDEVIVSENIDLPTADAGPDGRITCTDRDIDIGSTNTDTGSDIVISWTLDNVSISPTSPIFTATAPGIYVIRVENTTTGCVSTDEVVVASFIVELTDLVLDIDNPNCNGVNTGCIGLTTVLGGQAPYQVSLDGVTFLPGGQICNLDVGTYTFTVRDANGCEISQEATIDAPVVLSVQIVGNNVINYGDSTTLAAVHSPEDVEVVTYTWTSDNHFTTAIDSIIIATGLTEFIVNVTIEDENGCTASNQIIVYVFKDFTVYVPNAFSPNASSGINDRFFFMGDDDIVTNVDFLRIYTRWGEKVFERTNMTINDDSQGWDGSFEGQKLLPGVYPYVAQVTFVDGRSEQVKGEVIIVD